MPPNLESSPWDEPSPEFSHEMQKIGNKEKNDSKKLKE